MYRIFFLFLLCSFCFWFPSAFKRWTHAFRPAKCLVEWPFVPEWEIDPLPAEEFQEIHAILKQPFTYFSKGEQSYVFLSHDQNYVLKLFYYDTCRIPFGQKGIRWMRKQLALKEKHFLPTEVKIEKNFSSCQLAYHLARKLTGLVFIHLNPKKTSLPIISIKDRLGRSHHIDPALYRFVLQKKANRFSKVLSPDNACSHIQLYLTLLNEIAALGLVNLDVKLDCGFLDGRAVQIDIGNFIYCPGKAASQADLFVSRLRRWLKNEIPEALPAIDEPCFISTERR